MAKRFFCFDKFVRDKIPKIMESKGCIVHCKKLGGTDLLVALKKKLIEEAHEVAATQSVQDLQEELADLLEVISALAASTGCPFVEIEKIRALKNEQRGAFSQGIYVSSIKIDENNPEIEYYLARKKQYQNKSE